MKIRPFYFFAISFFIGIFLSSLGLYFFELLFWLLPIVFLLAIFSFFKLGKLYFWIKLILIFYFTFLFSSVYYYFYNHKYQGEFNYLLNQKIEQKFIIVDEPEKKSFHTKLILKFPKNNSRAIMWAPNYPEYFYGDEILVQGYLVKPKNFKSIHGREFDYISFLKKDKIFYEIKPVKIEKIGEGGGNIIKKYLFKLKYSFLGQIKKIIPGQEGSFLGGLILGAKEDMGKRLLEDFRKTGVIHIVVLSGYNLTLVADFFMKIFIFFGITFSTILASLSIVLFALMTGASATIVRASIMALLVILARATGRDSEIIRLLFLAGILMLLFNPMLLVFDPSFQLSFLATLGLILLSPFFEKKMLFLSKKFFDIRGILAATLSTQIFVFPLLLYMMGQISIVSPLVNILILIFIPWTMLIGFLAVIFSYFSIFFGVMISYLVYLILNYDLFLVEFFAKLPYAVWEYSLSFWEMLIIYFIYFLIFIFWKHRFNRKAI